MDLSIQQIFDIKFTLSGKSKSEIARELNIVNSNQLSNLERYKSLREKLDEYFYNLNPEIFDIVSIITKNKPDNSNILHESFTGYNASPKKIIDELRLDLGREKKINELLQHYVIKLEKENNDYELDLRDYDLKYDNIQKPTGSD